MKKTALLLFSFFYTFVFSFSAFGAVTTEKTTSYAEALALDAQSAILMDAATGEIIYNKNID